MTWIATRRDFLAALAAAPLTALAVHDAWAAPPRIRFGMVTDIHYADIDNAGARAYRESTSKLAECVEFMNRQQVDFLIELGDFKDQGKPPDEAVTLGYLAAIEKVFRGFRGQRYHVLGNHDVDSISKRQFLAAVGVPRRPSYFAIKRKGVRFLVLDANFRSDGKDYDHGNHEWQDCNLPPVELAWIEKTLEGGSAPAIVFIHQQLDGEGAYYVKNASAVRGVLEQSKKVRAVFQGHRHEGGYSVINGIHYYTLKSVIEGSGPENSAYAIVEADGQFNLTVTGYRRAESRDLAHPMTGRSGALRLIDDSRLTILD